MKSGTAEAFLRKTHEVARGKGAERDEHDAVRDHGARPALRSGEAEDERRRRQPDDDRDAVRQPSAAPRRSGRDFLHPRMAHL